MIEKSRNQEVTPIGRKQLMRALATRTVIEGLRHPSTFAPGEIGSVALPSELRMGFLLNGEFVDQAYHDDFDSPTDAA